MNTMKTITMAALLLGSLSSVAAAQDNTADCAYHDRARGECSIDTPIPTGEQLRNVIERGTATRLLASLDYGERVECYECVPALVDRALSSNNPRVREFAAWWIRRRPFAANRVFTLFKNVLATDADAVRRSRAAEALGEFMDPAALAPLSDAAENDAAADVRAAAVRGLGRLNVPSANAIIASALQDTDSAVRRAAIDQVIHVNFFREYDDLLGSLADEDGYVRRKAALLLGEFGVAEAVPALSAMLRSDADAGARQAAAWALGKIGGAEARAALTEVQGVETETRVLDALRVALQM
jgi:HEAT repeat protein